MHFSGIILGAAVFLIIGIGHPIVIKLEYYYGKNSWWVLFLAGAIAVVLSLIIENNLISSICGAFAFSKFWGIHELIAQEKRVLRGWFQENPARHEYYEKRRRELGDAIYPKGRKPQAK